MAPEVVSGGSYDGRADLFSVGVILWEIAHRKRFDANTYLYTSRALSYFDLARQYGGGDLTRAIDSVP